MTKFAKFVASTVDVKAGIDILVEDFGMSVKNMGYEDAVDMYVMEAINGTEKSIAVVSDDMNIAQTITAALNQAYTKEMELMKTVNVEEKTLVMEATTEEKKAASIAKSSAAQKFLAKHTKVEDKKEEVEVKEEVKVTGGRRRLNTGAQQQETTETKTNEKVETEMTKSNRKSTSRVLKETKKPVAEGRRRLGRSESIKNEFKKFEGPWYLNASMYEGLKRFETIIEDMADAELGIEQIVLVDPSEVSRTRNNPDI